MKRICLVLFIAVLFCSTVFAAHVHTWNFFAEDNCIKAYCTQTSEASECNYQGKDKTISLELKIGNSQQLKATVLPENATEKNVVWTSSDTSVVKVYPDGRIVALKDGNAQITASSVDGSLIVSDPITVNVGKRFTVTFNTNGATSGSVNSATAKEGEKISMPTVVLAKTGYSFGGWYKESSCTNVWAFNTDTVTADTTLYAKWTANTYAITYKDKDNATFSGTFGTNYPMIHTYGSTTTLINPTKTGYTFSGWYTSSDCTGSAVSSIGGTDKTSDFTLYAKWTAKTYTITYKDKDNAAFSGTFGTNYPTSHTYDSATALVSPTKSGYTFSGWFASSDCSGTAFTSIEAKTRTSDFTLYAKWTATSTEVNSSDALTVDSKYRLQLINSGTTITCTYKKTSSGFQLEEVLVGSTNMTERYSSQCSSSVSDSNIVFILGNLQLTMNTSNNTYSFANIDPSGDVVSTTTFVSFAVKTQGASSFTEIAFTKSTT